MKKAKKVISLFLVSLFLLSTIISVNAEQIADSDVIDSVISVISDISEKTTEMISNVNTNNLSITSKTTNTEITSDSDTQDKVEKKNSFSAVSSGAEANITSTGADVGTATTATFKAKNYAGNNITVTRKLTRYLTSNSAKYYYTKTNDNGTTSKVGKVYKIVITYTTAAGVAVTATWQINNESSLSAGLTKDDGTGTLTVNGNGGIGDWYDPGDNESAQSYTPWGVSGIASRTTKLVLGAGVTKTGRNSFRHCTKIKTATCTANGNLDTVNVYSFNRCDSLTSFELRNNPLKLIKSYAFSNCGNLQKITHKLKSATYTDEIKNSFSSAETGWTNIVTLPETVTTIEEYAFINCYKIQAINFLTPANSQLTEIGSYAFRNCIGLRFINIPNSLTTIKNNAFGVATTHTSTDGEYYNRTRYLYIAENTNLTTIEAGAFANSVTEANRKAGTVPNGVRIYPKTHGSVLSEKELYSFSNLTYLGATAFRNNKAFTGRLLFKKNCMIGGTAFANTALRNLYCLYDADAINSSDGSIESSQIGSSPVYSSSTRNFAITANQTITVDGKTYVSLYSVLQTNIEKWKSSFAGLGQQHNSFENWTADVLSKLAEDFTSYTDNDSNAPFLSVGDDNGVKKTYETYETTIQNPSRETASYLQTKVEWQDYQKGIAKETITFGYKNLPKVDFVFVVDTSGSMNLAANSSGKSFEGSNNVAKTITAFSQIYNIAQKVLPATADDFSSQIGTSSYNTVSVISFSNTEKNELENGSKRLGRRLSNAEAVYTALFNNDDGHETGASTNWSSGLSRAYKMIEVIRNTNKGTCNANNKQVVIFLSDGQPTYYSSKEDGAVGFDYSATTESATQVNGLDWARAIKGTLSYEVTSYSSSYYEELADGSVGSSASGAGINTLVSGLGVEIYGILIGTTASGPTKHMNKITYPNADVTNIEDIASRSPRTYKTNNLKQLSKAITAIINDVTSENYTVVIPLDGNFTLRNNSTISIKMKEALVDSDSTASNDVANDYTWTKTYTTSDTWMYKTLNEYKPYGRVKYNLANNCIIWDLTSYLNHGLSTSSSYITYEMTVLLNLLKGGTYVNGSSSNKPYYAVSTISSRNKIKYNESFSNIIEYISLGKYTTDKQNADSSYEAPPQQLYGAFAYINNKSEYFDESNSIPYEPIGDQHFLMNVAPAVYLPADTNSLYLYKEDEDGNRLVKGEFRIYDANSNLLTFYKKRNTSQYACYTFDYSKATFTTSYETISTNIPDGFIVVEDLPAGTYYIYESKYPSDSENLEPEYECTNSSKNKYTSLTLSDGTVLSCVSFEITPYSLRNPAVPFTLYNKKIYMRNKITGYKFDHNSRGVGKATLGLYREYPTDDITPITTTVSDDDGTFSFPVKTTGTYYIKELRAPSGYLKTNLVYEVVVSSLDAPTKLTSPIRNIPQSKIVIHVDSSDYTKSGFSYSLKTQKSPQDEYELIEEITNDTPAQGTLTYTVHSLYTDETFVPYGSIPSFKECSYFISQLSAPNNYYLEPEYSLTSFEDASPRYDGMYISKIEPGSETHVYVYNPSIKVKVNNYDGNDKTTPLQSNFLLDSTEYTTDENGTFISNDWYVFSSNALMQTKVPNGYNLLSKPVQFDITENSIQLAYDENGQRYYEHIETVYNIPKLSIPLTGGNGKLVFIIVSFIFLGIAGTMGVFYVYRKKKTT